jgi:membrane-bound lytic murein transglycosylase D
VRFLLLLTLLFCPLLAGAGNFPRPEALEPAVQFWIKVYTQISTNQGYVHDAENLAVVYERLELGEFTSRAVRQRRITDARTRVSRALIALARGKRTGLNSTEATVLAAWPDGTSDKTFALAAREVRFQTGQSDRFREGLVRSGQWKPYIRQVLAREELPQELEVLPHVESSFNPAAWSKVAAAGMWQFMPATARDYMRVDHVVDERMDPFIATRGAAKLLKRNLDITGTWPLALTAYNHGTGGMLRAARHVGTTDIEVIVQRYRGRAFGFASRNFYASFLAALEIDRHADRYFGPLQLDAPLPYDTVTPADYISAGELARFAGISMDELKWHNPALMEPVWNGDKLIPRGYPLRLPATGLAQPLELVVASLPDSARSDYQKPDLVHKIRPGESLSVIASRYGTSVSKLMALNGLRNHKIRAGKSLILPGNAATEPSVASS